MKSLLHLLFAVLLSKQSGFCLRAGILFLIFLLSGANFVSAAEKSLDEGTLDWLYSTGKTTSESAYTLTETDEASDNTITKYEYDSNSGTMTAHYYTISLKQTEYGNTESYDSTITYTLSSDIMSETINYYVDSSSTSSRLTSFTDGADLDYDFIGNIYYMDGYNDYLGGAIYNRNTTIGDITGNFIGNGLYAVEEWLWSYGGAILNEGTIGDITGDFIGNYIHSTAAYAGAILNEGTIGDITGDFIGNYVYGDHYSSGGAIYNWGTINSITGDFIGNYVYNSDAYEDTVGGAIFNDGSTIGDITGDFIGNYVHSSGAAYGGAVYNNGTIGATDDDGNITGGFVNSSFYNNYAEAASDTALGGAIYTTKDLNFISQDGYTTVFAGNYTNSAGTVDDNAIYVASSDATLTFSMTNGGSVYLADNINGAVTETTETVAVTSTDEDGSEVEEETTVTTTDGYNVVIEGDDTETTTFYLLNDIYNADVSFSTTTINTINNEVHVYDFNSLTITGDTNMIADVDLANEEMDRFTADSYGEHSGSLYVTGMNLLSDSEYDAAEIYFAESGLKDYVINAVSSVPDSNQTTVYSPIYKYLVSYENRDDAGYFVFTKYGTSGSTSTSTQNLGYESYNPAIMASPVAAQMGGYLVQLNSYDEAFRNMDMYMLLPKKQRMAMKMKNKYAVNSPVFDISLEREDKNYSGWARPYTTFEKVPLNNGPKVSNVAYGSFFGDESDMYDLGHGWDGVWGVYAGYNGSHQSYDCVGIWQNGGTLGLVGMAYKGNFFTGLTANVGANIGEAHSMYGNDNFSMLMTGAASKTGYNFEFADGKFVIQPHLLLSYSFVNTFNYTNAAGVRITSDPLHAIQVEPGVKFIGNLKNGWQPYLGVSFVWNIIDKTHFMANDVTLPNLSVDPFVKYGAGVRKSWGERLVGYFQTYITNGGRNGVGLQAGFKCSLGKTNSPKPSMRKSPTIGELPELKKTDFRLNYIK